MDIGELAPENEKSLYVRKMTEFYFNLYLDYKESIPLLTRVFR